MKHEGIIGIVGWRRHRCSSSLAGRDRRAHLLNHLLSRTSLGGWKIWGGQNVQSCVPRRASWVNHWSNVQLFKIAGSSIASDCGHIVDYDLM